jgi:hypothetical protein
MRLAFWPLAFLLACATPAIAENDDVATAQRIIRSQLDAFAHDDAGAAYSFASPGIRRLYPQSEAFLGMVQRNFAPVYRHQSFEFGDAQAAAGTVVQRAHIVDSNGEPWEALYTLERQEDGTLKISGCVLIKTGQGA